MRRITIAQIASVGALLLAATLLPVAPGAMAQADPGAAARAAVGAGPDAEPLPPHVIRRVKTFEIRDTGRFRTVGKVLTYRGKAVVLKKSNRRVGGYRYLKEARSNRNGRFAINFDGPVGTHFRIFLKATPRNRATTRYLGRIVPD